MFEVTNISKKVINIFDKSLKPMESYSYKDIDYTNAISNKVNLLSKNNFVRVDYHQDVIENIEEPIQIIDEPVVEAEPEVKVEVAEVAEDTPKVEEVKESTEETKKRGRKKTNA